MSCHSLIYENASNPKPASICSPSTLWAAQVPSVICSSIIPWIVRYASRGSVNIRLYMIKVGRGQDHALDCAVRHCGKTGQCLDNALLLATTEWSAQTVLPMAAKQLNSVRQLGRRPTACGVFWTRYKFMQDWWNSCRQRLERITFSVSKRMRQMKH